MRYFFFLLSIMMMSSCSNDKELKEKLETLYSVPIVFPDSGMLHVDNSSSPDKHENTSKSEYKLLVFCGPGECSTCAMNKMSEWNELLNLEKKGVVNMVFIFSPSKEEKNDVIAAYHTSGLEHSIELDTCGIFLQKNPQIPGARVFHTLLLDTNNNVVLVGDPVHNKEIEKLFYKIMGLNKQ